MAPVPARSQHRLLNQLTAIQVNLELLGRDAPLSPNQRRQLETALRGVYDLARDLREALETQDKE